MVIVMGTQLVEVPGPLSVAFWLVFKATNLLTRRDWTRAWRPRERCRFKTCTCIETTCVTCAAPGDTAWRAVRHHDLPQEM